MKVAKQWNEFGHNFIIEELPEPRLVGAGYRTHRLWDNGRPAYGGQWHYDVEGAESRAHYVLLCDYNSRIAFLENEVNVLRRENHELKSSELSK